MFDRWRRPIESVNKTWLGAVSIGVVAVVIAAVVGLANLPVSETGYTGEFAQAAQIAPGDRVTIAGIEVLKAFLDDGTGNEIEMKWSVIVFLAFSTAALIYAVTERLAEHK